MYKKIFFLSSLLIILCFFILLTTGFAENVRKPAWAGKFYPESKGELEKTIEKFSKEAEKTEIPKIPDKRLKALIMPHAGYIYSGLTAAHVSKVLRPGQFSKVILMGPDHRVGFNNVSLTDADAYETPLGKIKIHNHAEKLRESSTLFKVVPHSDKMEHSLEVILPFLQQYLKIFDLIPIVLGKCDFRQIAASLEPIIDNQTLMVASSDLSHYLTYDKAKKMDAQTIKMIMEMDTENLIKADNAACGKMPILVILHIAKKFNWQPVLLHNSNSGDTAGTKESVVGYAAIAFYGDNNMSENLNKKLTEDQGQALIRLARHTISEKLGKADKKKQDPVLSDKAFQANCGTFVTLTINDELRGCIGSLSSAESIMEGIKRNAVNAAFHDPRFPSLKANELNQIDIEVSVLTEPKPLSYKNADDLISKLRVNVDGVIIKKKYLSATFLPQVWEQLPDPEDFLSHLCLKAGLSSKDWKDGSLEVLTYQVQYFEEEKD
ncbi:MEMO1 family protein [Candidatus Magnetomoraceae bacterium gMMP-13]